MNFIKFLKKDHNKKSGLTVKSITVCTYHKTYPNLDLAEINIGHLQLKICIATKV